MADKNLTGGITAADALDGSELVHVVQGGNSRKTTAAALAPRIYTDTLSISGAASGIWNIPDDCVWFHIQQRITGPTGPVILTANLLQAADSAAGTFELLDIILGGSTANRAATTLLVNTRSNDSSLASLFDVKLTVHWPRSASIKTRVDTQVLTVGNQSNNHELYQSQGQGDVAEDHDQLQFSIDTGTLTQDIMITYAIQKAA